MRLVRLLLLTLALSLIQAHAQGDERRDGNWWQGKSRHAKVTFIVGFFDGMSLGHKFAYWGQTSGSESSGEATKSFNLMTKQYVNNVTSGQLVDGLDAFYSDFRNRRIRIDNGVWLVLNQISGMPAGKFDEMVESWRRNDK